MSVPRLAIEVQSVTPLVFADGSPVRAASAVARLGRGWLVAQDDATHAAWWRDHLVERVQIFGPVEGHELFTEECGTKHLKPDLEAACEVEVDGAGGVLLLGSGSALARMRAALVTLGADQPHVVTADLSSLYAAVATVLGVAEDELNLEGAAVLGRTLRWFHRGLPSAGVPTASVDLDLTHLVDVVGGSGEAGALTVRSGREYDLGSVEGVGLAVTDAVALGEFPGASQPLLASAAAEDAPNARDDGPVVGSALAVLDGDRLLTSIELPALDGRVCKVEGLALVEHDAAGALVLATVDADDPIAPSLALELRLGW